MYNGAFHSQATQIDDTLDMPIHANCLRLKNNSTVLVLQYLFYSIYLNLVEIQALNT